MGGITTLSIEIELAWGGHDLDNFSSFKSSISKDANKEREYLNKLLSLCERYGIRITFDIVGHLFLKECPGHHNGPHPEGWFLNDPGTCVESNPEYYAPDMIEQIRDSSVNHEIATHTFSHVPLQQMSDEVINWELKKSKEIHKEFLDESVTSLVPPRHSTPSSKLLYQNGIEIVRDISRPISNRSALRFIASSLFRSHPIQQPDNQDGVVHTYTTPRGSLNVSHIQLGQTSPKYVFKIIPLPIRKWLHRKYLERGIRDTISSNSYSHFWTHLQDISNKDQFGSIERFIKMLDTNDDISVMTMKQLNKHIRNNG